ncbi:MAG TPA: DUF4097 family beta strand repeat-containing protein, partial [Verrucomicrobiae bacterium]|nr:DUF4097 family beta strand repeat-containing protein [Verrucomicrobiae bacterium]
MKTKTSLFLNPFRVLLIAGLLLPCAACFAAASFESNLEKAFSANAGGKLVVEVDQGTVDILPVESGKVQIHVSREVRGGNKAQADELFDNHEVTMQQEGGTVTVLAKRKKNLSLSAGWLRGQLQMNVHYQISIPKRFDVDVKTAGGDIGVGDLDGIVKARTAGGSITLKAITGSIDASDAGGDITVSEASGELIARTSSGSINVQKVGKDAQLSDSGGDIRIGDAGQTVVARTSSGSIHLKTVKGDLQANNSG